MGAGSFLFGNLTQNPNKTVTTVRIENALILLSSTERGKQATFFFYKVDPFKV